VTFDFEMNSTGDSTGSGGALSTAAGAGAGAMLLLSGRGSNSDPNSMLFSPRAFMAEPGGGVHLREVNPINAFIPFDFEVSLWIMCGILF
jgi:hypothetical protein